MLQELELPSFDEYCERVQKFKQLKGDITQQHIDI